METKDIALLQHEDFSNIEELLLYLQYSKELLIVSSTTPFCKTRGRENSNGTFYFMLQFNLEEKYCLGLVTEQMNL